MSSYSKDQINFIIEAKDSGTTWEDLPSEYKKRFKKDRTMDALRSVYRRYKDKKSKPSPNILILDIETAPVIAHVWGLWNNNVGLNQIQSDWYILSWCAKWYGDPESEVMYMDQRRAKDIEDDSELLAQIWDLIDAADIVLTQNGKKFDIKKLNARFIINGYPPPSSFRQIDTLELAKRYFGFTSNRLAYMTEKLCTKYKKLTHSKFPGHELWKACLKGVKEAWYEMEEYNIHDVLSLEELYTKMMPWDNLSINFNLYHDGEENVCGCGSTEFEPHNFYYTSAGKYQKYRCVHCGHETRDNINLLTTEKRKSLKRKTVR